MILLAGIIITGQAMLHYERRHGRVTTCPSVLTIRALLTIVNVTELHIIPYNLLTET